MHILGEKYFSYCATIFLTGSFELREERLKARDGEHYKNGLRQFGLESNITIARPEVVSWASDVGYIADEKTTWL